MFAEKKSMRSLYVCLCVYFYLAWMQSTVCVVVWVCVCSYLIKRKYTAQTWIHSWTENLRIILHWSVDFQRYEDTKCRIWYYYHGEPMFSGLDVCIKHHALNMWASWCWCLRLAVFRIHSILHISTMHYAKIYMRRYQRAHTHLFLPFYLWWWNALQVA